MKSSTFDDLLNDSYTYARIAMQMAEKLEAENDPMAKMYYEMADKLHEVVALGDHARVRSSHK
tara:strand:+ start:405 stop:593 length:189 start_codon:yes stop_codon:yes gene_type:complete